MHSVSEQNNEQNMVDCTDDNRAGMLHVDENGVPFPWGGRGFVVGYVPEMHGPASKTQQAEITAFEAELLCRHWAGKILSIDKMWHYYGQTGSTEIRMGPYADSRLAYFERILGEDRLQAIVDEVYQDFEPTEEPGILLTADFDALAAETGFFGTCPECGEHNGFLNLEREHWFYCDEHNTKWNGYANVLSPPADDTVEAWSRNFAKLATYDEVRPVYPQGRMKLLSQYQRHSTDRGDETLQADDAGWSESPFAESEPEWLL